MENENYELLIDRKIYDDLPDELKYDRFTCWRWVYSWCEGNIMDEFFFWGDVYYGRVD